jgi:hypothetical protein
MRGFLLLLMLSCVYSFDEYCLFNNEEWCIDIDWETAQSLHLVVYKTWKRNYNSRTHFLMYCPNDPECNIPMHWEYETKHFATRKGAIEWINREFSNSPERMVSLREIGAPKKLESKTEVTYETKKIEKTEWSIFWKNQTN